MKIHVIAVGEKMPAWVSEGYGEYAKRLPPECSLELVEIPLARRGKSTPVERNRAEEAKRIEGALPKGALIVALEVGGAAWSTEKLAVQLESWLGGGRDVALLVGGPDGLDPALSRRANQRWSLSPLTLPHPLVRVVVAEQVYRAWTILKGHPYHK